MGFIVTEGLGEAPGVTAIKFVNAGSRVNLAGSATGALTYLGRYQRGQVVLATVATPGVPTGAPVVTLSDDATNTAIASYSMPIAASDMLSFSVPLHLDSRPPLGKLRLTFVFTVAGVHYTRLATFDLVDGGDSGGLVISMFSFARPEGNYILAQLDSGRLVQGRNPHLN